jgi:hypothetical protein
MLARCVPQKHHALCRPPKALPKAEIWRLPAGTGRWRKDNGDPGRAFVMIDGDDATVWVANCKCPIFLKCPVAIALAKVSALGCEAATVERRRATPRPRRRSNKVRRAR